MSLMSALGRKQTLPCVAGHGSGSRDVDPVREAAGRPAVAVTTLAALRLRYARRLRRKAACRGRSGFW